MKIGHKIRKIREMKGLSQENVAEALIMSPNGYAKIERNEVDVNFEKIEKIALFFEMKPEDLVAFDEKTVLNFLHNNQTVNGPNGVFYYGVSEKERELYEETIKLLKEKVALLEEKMEWLKTTK